LEGTAPLPRLLLLLLLALLVLMGSPAVLVGMVARVAIARGKFLGMQHMPQLMFHCQQQDELLMVRITCM
jgi:hypothetical protein